MPGRRRRRVPVLLGIAGLLAVAIPTEAGEGEDLFEREVRPYLAERCYGCHASSGRHEHDLALDWAGGMRSGGFSGPAVVPGRPAESLILAALRQEEGLAMPKGAPKPSATVVAAFERWIALGAPDPRAAPQSADELARETSWEATFARRSRWWSLQPIRRPALPANAPAHPIDAFVQARLAAAALAPAPPADRVTLIRRLTFDLVGLPPEPDEIDEFVADTAADAYERLVDRLLASPRYGERWGRHWLDAVRYTESQGFEYDHPRANAWHYRDYVIESLNADVPYDRFMREQIAGDVIEPVTTAGIVATSMLVCGAWDQAGSSQSNATQRALTREEEMEDLVSVVGQTFLGLTINCARCHAHKFDPVAQEEYFQIRAVFDGVKHGERPAAARLDDAARAGRLAALEAELAASRESAARAAAGTGPRERAARAAAAADAEALERAIAATRNPPLSYVGTREQPPPARLLARGDVTAPGAVVTPRGLAAITTLPADLGLAPDAPEGARRLAFAGWLADPRNPLPARVIVNRVWQLHFGQGIVATPNDFGASGALPTHPELLDWLAAEFIDRGWSLKALHRLIVTSATYRQSSAATQAGLEADAENTLLWRFAPRRLEAEAVRDAMLAVSGRLDLRTGGPSFRPFTTSSHGATFYHLSDRDDPAWNRRTVYRMNINSGKEPLLDALDCPDPAVKTPRRGATITPLQSLSLMNAPFVQRQAVGLAARARALAGDDPAAGVAAAYRIALGRPAEPAEVARALGDGRDLERVAWALLNATEFVHVR